MNGLWGLGHTNAPRGLDFLTHKMKTLAQFTNRGFSLCISDALRCGGPAKARKNPRPPTTSCMEFLQPPSLSPALITPWPGTSSCTQRRDVIQTSQSQACAPRAAQSLTCKLQARLQLSDRLWCSPGTTPPLGTFSREAASSSLTSPDLNNLKTYILKHPGYLQNPIELSNSNISIFT